MPATLKRPRKTRYQKSIKVPGSTGSVLKRGDANKKLGFTIEQGPLKGQPIYSLTLVERETCDSACHHWSDCYGDNMPFAHRFKTKGLTGHLTRELKALAKKHPGGFVVRLHVLGDFYSVAYVNYWRDALDRIPALTVYGYTGRPFQKPIGAAIVRLNEHDRSWIRFSQNESFDGINSYAAEESFEGPSFDCPEQTGKVDSCAGCGLLCFTVRKTVRFLSH